MTLSVTWITQIVGHFVWPFARIGAMLMAMPILGTHYMPVRARLLFAVMLTAVIAPHITSLPKVVPFSLEGMVLLAGQILVGIAMGFVFSLVFQSFLIAGQVIAIQSGLGFATLVDPSSGAGVPLLSQFYLMLVTLVFLSMNGHLLLIQLLANSFQSLPIGFFNVSTEQLWRLIQFSASMFTGGLMIALPAVVALLIVNVSFGVMTRSAPQLNIFAIGFPITLMLGLAIVYITSEHLIPHIEQLFDNGFTMLRQFTGA